jgi:outer membrane biosynthesis protein TonB
VNTSILEEELAPLNAQIKQAQQKREALEEELRTVEAALKTFSDDRQRFDALRDVCSALDKLEELKAEELFWEGIPEAGDVDGHMKRMRNRVARFEGEIHGILEKQASLQEQIDRCHDEMSMLFEEVRDAYDREERRKEEFVIEREIPPAAYREMIMPWTKEAESERRFRRAVLVALLACFVLGGPIPLIKVPIPDIRVAVVEIPKRLVKLVKKESARSAPIEKPMPRLAEKEPEQPKKETKQAAEKPKQAKEKFKPGPERQKAHKPPKGGESAPKPSRVAAGGGGGVALAARKRARHIGVLAFSDAFKDLMKETPVAKLGTEARLNHKSQRVAGRAVAQRSLVTRQAQDSSSGGIGNAGVSRNIGNGNVDRLGGFGIGSGSGNGYGNGDGSGVGIVRVESNIANLEESSRPLSDGLAAGRTDEEIQIVFDRYKAALYRIYNRELRKDPTLRGKILLRISIEPNGEVSMCRMESTDLASPELVAKIVERIKRFNFGPKEGVPKMTILYPIDFLPAG